LKPSGRGISIQTHSLESSRSYLRLQPEREDDDGDNDDDKNNNNNNNNNSL
jgi:hypothetical protein